jgi:DNA-binding transcriptional regulator YiaG
MAYQISGDCIGCNACVDSCPTKAIVVQDGEYWINPLLCNDCEGFFPEPQCVSLCPGSAPQPYEAMKGRNRTVTARIRSSPPLFLNGHSQAFASSIVVWEACNFLSQFQSLNLQKQGDNQVCYQKSVGHNQGSLTLTLCLDGIPQSAPIDVRTACLHLIFAAYAAGLDSPWKESFVFTDSQLESYLGWDKRKDLSKMTRLHLFMTWIEQLCRIQVSIDWPDQGRVKGFSVPAGPLWRLLKMHRHFQKDEQGCNHLVGLTWAIQPGEWTRYFLNRQGCRQGQAFYQYSSLPLSLLQAVMSHWQHHEGAMRLLLWLLFKVRMGRQQRLTVPTLMRVAYGEERLQEAYLNLQERKRLVRTFESDLEVLNHYGLKPEFDPLTYPSSIQPLWARLEAVPEDADEALNFWIEDANNGGLLTAAGPRGKWGLLMQARIQRFHLPSDWHRQAVQEARSPTRESGSRRQRRAKSAPAATASDLPCHPEDPKDFSSGKALRGADISAARQQKGISQRELAQRLGRSQSWVRDVENDRLQISLNDRQRLFKALYLDPRQHQV